MTRYLNCKHSRDNNNMYESAKKKSDKETFSVFV